MCGRKLIFNQISYFYANSTLFGLLVKARSVVNRRFLSTSQERVKLTKQKVGYLFFTYLFFNVALDYISNMGFLAGQEIRRYFVQGQSNILVGRVSFICSAGWWAAMLQYFLISLCSVLILSLWCIGLVCLAGWLPGTIEVCETNNGKELNLNWSNSWSMNHQSDLSVGSRCPSVCALSHVTWAPESICGRNIWTKPHPTELPQRPCRN